MATEVQRRRGTTTEQATFTGADGELTVDTTKKTVVVHDGTTVGGVPLAREDLSNVDVSPSAVTPGTARQLLQTDAAGTGVEWTSNVDIPGTLDVTSTATFDGIASHPRGTAAAPAVTFTSDTNTGIYSPGADQVAISTNSTERVEFGTSEVVFNDGGKNYDFRIEGDTTSNLFFVDASANAVGIGTSAPSSELHVAKLEASDEPTLRIQSENSSIYLRTAGSSGSFPTGGGGNDGELLYLGGDFRVGTGSSARNVIFINGSTYQERARIDSSGRLLVGTPTTYGSSANLQVVGTLSAAASIDINRFTNGTGSGSLYFYKSRGASVGTNTIVNSGDELGAMYFMGANGTSYNLAASIIANVDGTPGASNDMPGRLVFSVTADGASSPTERMRITNDGAIQIGTTSDPSSTNFGTHIGLKGSSALLGYFATSRNVGAANAVAAVYGTDGLARVMGDGDLENTNNRYTGISDVKYKQNIEDASSQWDDIKAIQVRKYELIANPDRKHIGVIAQELEQICPGLVITRNEDDEGTETYKSVAYSVLYMKAVKALQEAMERIETLEAKVAALETK